MAENKTIGGEANLGFAEETRDYTNRVTAAWAEQANRATAAYNEAANRWVGAVQQITPALAPDSVQVPDARQIWNAYFDVLEQTVAVQRQLAEKFLDSVGGLVTIDGAPAHQKVAERVSQATEQAATAAKQATEDTKDSKDAGQGNGNGGKPAGSFTAGAGSQGLTVRAQA